eukprot:jgi/Undpi1/8753/HiC_scaffold_25.g11215.m1
MPHNDDNGDPGHGHAGGSSTNRHEEGDILQRMVKESMWLSTPGAAAAPPASATTSVRRAARTEAALPVPRPDLAWIALAPSITRFEDLPCVTQGRLGAGTVCKASCVCTADGTAYDAGPQAELVYRLTPLVTTVPPVVCREVAAGKCAHQTAEMVGDRTPETEELPSATIEPPVSTADGAGRPGSANKGSLDKDDADFVHLLTALHDSQEDELVPEGGGVDGRNPGGLHFSYFRFWVGTSLYFFVSGKRQQPVTGQQWPLVIATSVLSSLLLIALQTETFTHSALNYEEILSALGPAVVMVIASRFFGKNWSTSRQVIVALLVVSMVLASFNRLDPSLSKLTATAPFVVFTAALLVLKGELLNGDMEMSPVQLVSRTAPLALAQMVLLVLDSGELTTLLVSSVSVVDLLRQAAVIGSAKAALSLCFLQAIKVTSPLSVSITLCVCRVLKDGVSRVKHGKPARADLLAIVVTASVLYALLNYIERSIALTRLPRLTRAPDLPPPREKSRRWVVEGPAEEEKNTMLRPLLGAEVHSAARQQCLPVCTV